MAAENADEALLEIRMIVELQPVQNRRHRLARGFRQGVAVAVIVIEPVLDDRLRNGLAPNAAHGARQTIDLDQ